MSNLTIPRNYGNNDPENTITAAKLGNIATTINTYFNTETITASQVKINTLTVEELNTSEVFDLGVFSEQDNIWGFYDLTDSQFAEVDGEEFFTEQTVSWNRLQLIEFASPSGLTPDTNSYIIIPSAIDEQVDYAPDIDAENLLLGDAPRSVLVRDTSIFSSFVTPSIQLTTRGGPVVVGLVPGSVSASAYVSGVGAPYGQVGFLLVRADGEEFNVVPTGQIVRAQMVGNPYTNGTPGSHEAALYFSNIIFYDTPPAGTYSYLIRYRSVFSTGSPPTIDLTNMKLVAYEIV